MTADLGALATAAAAVGLIGPDGSLVTDWFTRPSSYLTSVLRTPHQREAMTAFVDEVLGGDSATTAPDGATWLPLFGSAAHGIGTFAVIRTDESRVITGAAMRLDRPVSETRDVGIKAFADVPLFTQPLAGGDVTTLVGRVDSYATVGLAVELRAAHTQGGVSLSGADLTVDIPLAGQEPRFTLSIRDLEVPGANGPETIEVTAANLDQLDDLLLRLVLGIVRSYAAGLPAQDPVRGLAGLLGLTDAAVPDLPLADLVTEGVGALVSWLGDVFVDESATSAWLGQVADFVGGAVSATPEGPRVRIDLGAADLLIGVRHVPGPGGRLLSPVISVTADGASGVVLAATAEPFSVNVATGGMRALPRLEVQARLRNGAAALVPVSGAGLARVGLGELRTGFALDAGRRPALTLQALDATVGTTHFDVLDLTSADALAAGAEQVLSNAAGSLLAGLGTLGEDIALVIGLPFPNAPAVPLVDAALLLSDPLAAVSERWIALFAAPPGSVSRVLSAARDLVGTVGPQLDLSQAGTNTDPWIVPWVTGVEFTVAHEGGAVSVGLQVRRAEPDLGGAGLTADLSVRATLAELGLASPRSAHFLPAAATVVTLRRDDDEPMGIGFNASTLTAQRLGLRLEWRAGAGVSVRPAVEAGTLGIGAAAVDWAEFDNLLTDLPDVLAQEAADLLEPFLAMALPLVADTLAGESPVFGQWVASGVSLLGWDQGTAPGRPGGASGARLSLAALSADPAAELERFLGDVLDVSESSLGLNRLLDLVAAGIGPGVRTGAGTDGRPWSLPLLTAAGELAADLVPSLVAWIGPDAADQGPRFGPTIGWQPGDPPLGSEALTGLLYEHAQRDDSLADLVAGRGDLVVGMDALVARWAHTDGLVSLPETGLPAGIVPHRLSDCAHDTPLADLSLGQVLPPMAATVFYVALADRLLPEVAHDRRLDLSPSPRPPESFTHTPSDDPTGAWTCLLGTRAACRLPNGDLDGVLGQAARLVQALRPLLTLGPVSLIAHGGAGHAAALAATRLATDGLPVADVITVGTPWSPLTVDTLDHAPAAETMRLLAALLPEASQQEPDDPDLSTARRILDLWLRLDTSGDPVVDLRLPTTVVTSAAVPVQACVGGFGEETVRRALTAATVTGLVKRAWDRAGLDLPAPEFTRYGVRWPLLPQAARGGLITSLTVDLDLFGTAPSSEGLTPGPAVAVKVLIGANDGWLLGGPDPGRLGGPERTLALRRLTARVRIPIDPTQTPTAVVDLHDAYAFGTRRTRWRVAALAPSGDVVTALVPEVRALLGGVIGRLRASAESDPTIRGVYDALVALGVVDASGALDAVTLDGLLIDARSLAAAVRAEPARRTALALAFAAVSGVPADGDRVTWKVDADGVVGSFAADLATGTIVVEVSGGGGLAWSASATLAGAMSTEGVRATLRVGGLEIDLAPSLIASLHLGSAPALTLWPGGSPALVTDLLRRALPSVASHAVIAALLELARTEVPPAEAGLRTLASLVGIPGVVRPEPAVLAAGLLDAAGSVLGLTGDPGHLALTEHCTMVATAVGTPSLTLVLAPRPPGASRLDLSGSLGLRLGQDLEPQLSLTVQGAPGGLLLRVGGTGPPVALSLIPDGGAEIVLFPSATGLAGLTDVALGAAVRALPTLLDRVAGQDPAGDPATATEVAGRLVARLGDALGFRTVPPNPKFDGDVLVAFGTNPASALAARGSSLGAGALQALVEALDPALGAFAVTTDAGALVATLGPVTLRWTPQTNRFGVVVALDDFPGVQHLSVALEADSTGLLTADLALGPATLDAGGLVLRPYARAALGSSGPVAEIGLGSGGARLLVGQWAEGDLSLLARTGSSDSEDPVDVATAVVETVIDLVGSLLLGVPEVEAALNRNLALGISARELLTGVLLDEADNTLVAPNLLDPDLLLARAGTFLANAAENAVVPLDEALTLGAHVVDLGADGRRFGLTVGLIKPWAQEAGDIRVTVEQLSSWITAPEIPGGLTLDLLTVGTDQSVAITPGLVVGGLGLRIGKTSGPLVDTGLTLQDLALHLFADLQSGVDGDVALAGGVRIELGGLSVGLSGASGGSNAVASGMLGSGSESPRPAFSPALAVQAHGGGAVEVTLTAGTGTGPWWVVIQKGFGPVYVEQIGFAVTVAEQHLKSLGLLIDGKVSLLGLSASVDDLSLTYVVGSGSPLSSDAWVVDLAGLAISADLAGMTLAGGLRKFPVAAGGSEYLGLLMARLAAYGISVYGGYGIVGPTNDRFASLFLFGAVNGPIGGPPAFFITGIGGGFGINRGLSFPSDLSNFGDFPFIKALDPGARPGEPMAELAKMRDYFPAERGSFWFAAGISFTSFALVDGVAVVAVRFGDGLDVALIGLARMALPTPSAALISVELGLLARVSTREGVILVQAQLTDNSWLLFPEIRLTGGFAFATWFGGPNKGRFVVSMGGYHPNFHRDGYPVVPRLGMSIKLLDGHVTITGETYAALTSEAVMAGTKTEVHASLGPAWAHLAFGADGIVLFDPFWFEVTVYAAISAGVTIDVWIGEITISVHLSARVTVSGPPFHGKATFEIGPVDLTVEFGDSLPPQPTPISWAQFAGKYLEPAPGEKAHLLTAIPGKGAVPPSGEDASGGSRSPDGSDAQPFRVVSEFVLTITSIAPLTSLTVAGTTSTLDAPPVSAAPMKQAAAPTVTVTFVGPAHDNPQDRAGKLAVLRLFEGAFPVGVWGLAQEKDRPLVPRGEVLRAVDKLRLTAEAELKGGTGPIEYRQVEVGRRRPLPFVTEAGTRAVRATSAKKLEAQKPVVGEAGVLTAAAGLLARASGRTLSDAHLWTLNLVAAPALGSLAEGLGAAPPRPRKPTESAPPRPQLRAPRPARLVAVLGAAVGSDTGPEQLVGGQAGGDVPAHTSVSRVLRDRAGLVRSAPPTLAGVTSDRSGVPARLLLPPAIATVLDGRVFASRASAATQSGLAGTEEVAGRGASAETRKNLAGKRAQLSEVHAVAPGQVYLLERPDADWVTDPAAQPVVAVHEGALRVVALGPGATALTDAVVGAGEELRVPPLSRRIALVAQATTDKAGGDPGSSIAGWASDGPLPYVGDEVSLGRDCLVVSAGRVATRGTGFTRAGWTSPEQLVSGTTAVTTRFAGSPDVVAVAVDGGTADDLSIGLEGLARTTDAAGNPEPPLLVSEGPTTIVIFSVVRAAGRADAASVTVASGPQRHLLGVAGGTGISPAGFAEAVAAHGFAVSVPSPLPTGTVPATVTWKES